MGPKTPYIHIQVSHASGVELIHIECYIILDRRLGSFFFKMLSQPKIITHGLQIVHKV